MNDKLRKSLEGSLKFMKDRIDSVKVGDHFLFYLFIFFIYYFFFKIIPKDLTVVTVEGSHHVQLDEPMSIVKPIVQFLDETFRSFKSKLKLKSRL